MSQEFDLVLRKGTIIDGSGAEPFEGDVAVSRGRIVAVGEVAGTGREEIDARHRLVTPGFVDVHTHYDGHATWTDRLTPSSQHGVTTVVTGNCGVGFAPCRPENREALVHLMEGVEDIPEPVITAGLPWAWESFPDYLQFLSGRDYDMDIACLVPHAPLRVHVMGQRASQQAPATVADVAQMRALAAEAMRAGAIGFGTSRSLNHRSTDGHVTPSYSAAAAELEGIAAGVRDAGPGGVLQLISDFDDVDREFAIVERMAASSGLPISFSLMQHAHRPDRWRQLLDKVESANSRGLRVRGQVIGRPIGMIIGLELSFNPFTMFPSYQAIANLPLAERVEAMRDPDLRRSLLAEEPIPSALGAAKKLLDYWYLFPLAEDLDYLPPRSESFAGRAERQGRDAREMIYDYLVAGDGRNLIYVPAVNYVDGETGAIEQMLRHPDTLYGLGDGGAHCSLICDASMPTYMLSQWARSGRIPLPEVVKGLSADGAAAMGLHDRGRVAAGCKADLNVIDYDRLALRLPRAVYDLPTGGRRLEQRADGYDATVVSGAVVYRQTEATGALPGRLVRGTR